MYCGECGAKLEKGAIFCGECGSKVESPKGKITSSNNTSKQITPKKPISQKNKIIIGVSIIIILLLILGYNFLNKKFGPEGVAEDYFKAVVNVDANALYNYLNIEGDKTFVNKESFKELLSEIDSEQNITNYTVSEVEYEEGSLSARVIIKYTAKDSRNEMTEYVYLTKAKEKKFLIFDKWEVKEDFDSIIVKDYKIKVPTGSKVTINKTELKDEYLDKSSSSNDWDVYLIPQIFRTKTKINTNLPIGYVIEDEVTPSGYAYTAKLELSKLSSDDVKKLENKVKSDMTTLYKNMIDKKDWNAVKETYNIKGVDMEELEDAYSDLYDDVAEHDSKKLKKFEITSVNINNVTTNDDGQLRVSVKLGYNYTLDYTDYNDTVTEKTGKSNFSPYLTYENSGEELKLYDASYLVSYFSVR